MLSCPGHKLTLKFIRPMTILRRALQHGLIDSQPASDRGLTSRVDISQPDAQARSERYAIGLMPAPSASARAIGIARFETAERNVNYGLNVAKKLRGEWHEDCSARVQGWAEEA